MFGKNLNGLISEKLTSKIDFKGSVYVYLTVTENAEIENKNQVLPQTDEIDKLFKEATEKIRLNLENIKRKLSNPDYGRALYLNKTCYNSI